MLHVLLDGGNIRAVLHSVTAPTLARALAVCVFGMRGLVASEGMTDSA